MKKYIRWLMCFILVVLAWGVLVGIPQADAKVEIPSYSGRTAIYTDAQGLRKVYDNGVLVYSIRAKQTDQKNDGVFYSMLPFKYARSDGAMSPNVLDKVKYVVVKGDLGLDPDRNKVNHFLSGMHNVEQVELNDLDVTKVKDMSSFFFEVHISDTSGIQDWSVRNVTSMQSMFTKSYLRDLSGLSDWDVGKVSDMSLMFSQTFISNVTDLSRWDVGNVMDMHEMFNVTRLSDISGLSNWDTGRVTDMSAMFTNTKISDISALSSWDTRNVTNMAAMFAHTNISDISTLANWDMNNVMLTYQMFAGSPIRTIGIGEKTRFHEDIGIKSTDEMKNDPEYAGYTGYWVRADGSHSKPLTTEELLSKTLPTRPKGELLKGEILGTWVLEEKNQTYTLKFDSNGGIWEMLPETLTRDVAYTLPQSYFYKEFHKFVGWRIKGKTYEAGQEVNNLANAGETVTAEAVWEALDNSVTIEDGVFYVDIPAGENVTLPSLPAGLGYEVIEEIPAGWNLVREENTSGKITADQSSLAQFVNEDRGGHETSIQFTGEKELDGERAGGFEFELRDEWGTLIERAVASESGAIIFKPILYGSEGKYDYVVKEVIGKDSSINYDTSEKKLQVEVKKDEQGNLAATLLPTSQSLVFKNTTKPVKFTIKKLVEGTTKKRPNFTIKLTVNGKEETVSLAHGQTKTFTHLKDGDHYTVDEVNLPAGYQLKGITNKEGRVKAGQNINVVVTNTYQASGSVNIEAQKELVGRDLKSGEFTFDLVDDQGRVVDTVKNDANGHITFNAQTVTKPGKFTYSIREVKGNDATVQYDTTTKSVVLTATDQGNGQLDVKASYPNGNRFTNKTSEKEVPKEELTTATLKKVVENETPALKNKEYTVSISLKDPNGKQLEGDYTYQSDYQKGYVKSGDSLRIKVGEVLNITNLPEGTFVEVKEEVPQGFTLNKEKSTLSGQTSLNKPLSLNLVNTYSASGEFVYKAKKHLRGADLKNYTFKFEIRDGYRLISKGQSNAQGEILFEPISYHTEDIGKIYTYQVHEVNDRQEKIRYDKKAKELKVTISDDGQGHIIAEPDTQSMVFNNAYDDNMPATGTFGAWPYVMLATVLLALTFTHDRFKKSNKNTIDYRRD